MSALPSPGQLYFFVQYVDPDRLVPLVQTVIFIGKNIDNEGDDLWYFQDMETYSAFGPYPHPELGPGDIFVLPEEGLAALVNLDAALKNLSGCLGRRQGCGLE